MREVIGTMVGSRQCSCVTYTNNAIKHAYPDLGIAVKRLYDTVYSGSEFQTCCHSPENQQAVSILDKGLRKLELGYEAPILWKEGESNLPDNRMLPENRLRCRTKKFRKDPNYENNTER